MRSNTISEYQHIGDDDLKDMQLEINGITKSKEDKPREFKPINCPHCNKRNEYDAEFCLFCNQALSQKRMIDESDKIKNLKEELQDMKEKQLTQEAELEKRRKMDKFLNKIMENPKVLEMLAN